MQPVDTLWALNYAYARGALRRITGEPMSMGRVAGLRLGRREFRRAYRAGYSDAAPGARHG